MCKDNIGEALAEHLKFRPQGLRAPAERTGFFTFDLLTTHNADTTLNLVNRGETNPFKLNAFAKKLVDGVAAHEHITLAQVGVVVPQETPTVADMKVLSKAASRAIVRIKAGGRVVCERLLGELLAGTPQAELSDDDAGTENVFKSPQKPMTLVDLAGAFHMGKDDKLEVELDWPGSAIGAVGATTTLVIAVKAFESSGR